MSDTDDDACPRAAGCLRPPVDDRRRTERIFLLVGAAALFAGYDVNDLRPGHVRRSRQRCISPKTRSAPTLAYFRAAAIVALLLAASADLVGRRRLLLVTIFGQAIFTFATAFAPDFRALCRRADPHPHLRLCRGDAVLCGDRRGNRGAGARLGQRHADALLFHWARAWPRACSAR